MSTKKIALSVIGLAMLAGIIYVAVQFVRSDKSLAERVVPEIHIAHTQLTNLTAERADMKMTMIVDNPAPVGIKIDSLYYTISIEGNEVTKTTYPDSLIIEASDSATVSLPLTVYYDRLGSVLKALEKQGRDSATYRVDAVLYSNNPMIPVKKINLDVEKELPLVKIPDIKLKGIKVENLTTAGVTLQVETFMNNENVFPIGFEDMSYRMQIEGHEWMEGQKPGKVKIPAHDSATFTVPIELTFKEMGKSLVELIRKGDDLQYSFDMQTKMVSDVQMLEDSKMSFNSSGKVKTLVDVAKEQLSEKAKKK
jgi:LEA14-like dessication related protein